MAHAPHKQPRAKTAQRHGDDGFLLINMVPLVLVALALLATFSL